MTSTTKKESFLHNNVYLIENQMAQQYFKYNLESYCNTILTIITRIESNTQLLDFLRIDELFNKNIVDQDDFYKHFINNLLLPLINVLNKFNEAAVFKEMSRIVQKCIFNKKFKIFDNYLRGYFEKKDEVKEKHSLPKHLIKFLVNSYNEEATSNCAFKLIFDSFCGAYSNFELVYKMFIIILEIIGFNTKNKFNLIKISKLQTANTTLNKSLEILSEMIIIIMNKSNVTDCKLNEISFVDFMKDLLKWVIALTGAPNNCCYDILLNTMSINQLIIEPIITEIIVYAMLNDNSQNQQKYEELQIKIFEVFAKLHRIQNLISKMIPTLKTALADDVKPKIDTFEIFKGIVDVNPDRGAVDDYDINCIFPNNLLQYFTLCITNLASWQVMNLVKTLLFHFDVAVNEISIITEDSTNLFYMEILSTLICWVLSSVRIAEHTVTSTVVEKFIGSLEEFRSVLKKFGMALLHKEHNHRLMKAFLNISYTWAEIYMTIAYYSINNEITIKKAIDNDYSSCNITYLHSYLSVEQWCLISERISNFGGKPCKEIMQKLIIQKLRAMLIFEDKLNDDVVLSIVKTLCTNLEDSSIDLLTDQFIVNNILNRMPTDSIIYLSDCILNEVTEKNNLNIFKHFQIYNNSEILLNAMICVIFKKIHNLMKQKRKHGEEMTRKVLLTKIYSSLPEDIFLYDNVTEDLENASKIFLREIEGISSNDLKINDVKINIYLNVLKQLPVIFCLEDKQKLVLLLILSLQNDICINSNCESNLREICEDIVIGILQSSKFSLLNVLDCNNSVNVIVNGFVKYEELFTYFIENLFKSEELIEKFKSGINYIKGNLKKYDKYLKCSIIVLHAINKIKKTKMSAETKQICLDYKSVICNEIVNVISTKDPSINLVEPYAILLKIFLSKDENSNLEKLCQYLNIYLDFTLTNLSNANIKGNLLLFTTILHHKSGLNDINEDVVIRIWNVCKIIKITNNNLEEYSQLINLIFGLISHEEISNLTNDLLNAIVTSVEDEESEELIKCLKTCTFILTCNFNQTKVKILQEFLENVLEKLILTLKRIDYEEGLFKQIIAFEITIIHTIQFLLTPAIIDLLLLSVTTLMMKKCDFIESYKLSISVLDNLLKSRKPLIMDRLPSYLQQYRILLKELCIQSNSDLNLESTKILEISDSAHQLEKLTNNLIACPRDMIRISPYLIADILDQYEQITLYPNVKIHLNNCIYSLISLCDQHAVSYLMRVLSTASTEIFKMMYENYKKYYRFTGKV